jgi:putative endonuclease
MFHGKRFYAIMPKYMGIKTQKQEIGQIGEDIATRFLVKHSFEVILRNYRKKFGEIDIIARKDGKIHFVEVKTVSQSDVSHETIDQHRPEDNIHEAKLKRIGRTIEAYIFEHETKEDWQFDVITIILSKIDKIARVRMMSDLIL